VISKKEDKEGRGGWCLFVLARGGKNASVPLPSDILAPSFKKEKKKGKGLTECG